MAKAYQKQYYVASLTENINSTTLWAHYANNSRGFAVSYSIKNLSDYIIQLQEDVVDSLVSSIGVKKDIYYETLIDYIKRVSLYFGPVNYNFRDSDVTVNLIEIIRILGIASSDLSITERVNIILTHMKNPVFVSNAENYKNKVIVGKDSAWKYEKEWRFVMNQEYNSNYLTL